MEIILVIIAIWFLLIRKGGQAATSWGPLESSKYYNTAKYWKAVSAMETAGWTSRACRELNNYFGMKMPKVRKTTAVRGVVLTAGGAEWASYTAPSDSVKDIVLYMDAFNYPTAFVSLRAMVDFMGVKGYYGLEPSDSYYNKVLAWAKKMDLKVDSEVLAA